MKLATEKQADLIYEILGKRNMAKAGDYGRIRKLTIRAASGVISALLAGDNARARQILDGDRFERRGAIQGKRGGGIQGVGPQKGPVKLIKSAYPNDTIGMERPTG